MGPKPYLPPRRAILGGLVFGGLAAGSQASAADDAVGRVLSVTGEAVARLRENQRMLAPNAGVFVGDRIATAEQTRAALSLAGKTELRIGERAKVTIDQFLIRAGGTISLGAGALLMDKQPDSAEVKIRSVYGLIAVRGTQLFVGPSNDMFSVFVSRGHVLVTAGGRSVTVRAGEGTEIAAPGASPTTPSEWKHARIIAALGTVT